MYGWIGRVLRINLTNRDYAVEELDPALCEKFIGSRGLGVKLFFDEVDAKIEPLSEENKLVFMTGPLTGTGAPSADGCYIVTKSPLTGALAMGRFGGELGPELKFAGYDGLIIEGKAESPMYITITNDEIEFKDASHLWGKTAPETEDALRADIIDPWKAKDYHIATIGPAGEKLVRVSAVVSGKHHLAARSGIGAIMGYKNLKAIMVRGTKDIPIANGEAFFAAQKKLLDLIQRSPVLSEHLPNYGKINVAYQANARAFITVKNFHESTFAGVAKTNGRILRANHLRRGVGCYSCPIACVRLTESFGGFAGKGGGPEFQSVTMLGADCCVDDMNAILKANYLCNELGMDTISVGGTIACAMDMYEAGLLTKEECGCELKFGNAEALVQMVEAMGRRTGFGDKLAEGGARLAEQYGHPEYFMGVKRQELPGWNARVMQGGGLEFATANNGGCHTKGGIFNAEVWGIPEKLDPAAIEGKVPKVIYHQDRAAHRDTTGLCSLLSLAPYEETAAELLSAATGVDYDVPKMSFIGERIWNLERLFNVNAGFTSIDDLLPKRMIEEPITTGPHKGMLHRIKEMLPDYYEQRGWDENGVPKPEKLAELELP